MAKKIVGFIKLQVPAGKANPSPPIGPALGQRGLNIMEFCKAFNAQTQGMEPGLPAETLNELRSRGHDMPLADRWSTDFGRAQLIYKMDDGYLAASERRTDGQAVGY